MIAKRVLLTAALAALLVGAWFLHYSPDRATPVRDTSVASASRTGDASPADGGGLTSHPATAAASRNRSRIQRTNPSVLDESLGQFAARYPTLAAAASRGDIVAAMELYRTLYRCLDAPRSVGEIDDAAGLAKLSGIDARSAREFAENRFKQCAPVSVAQRDAFDHRLSLAAESGDSEARLDFVRFGRPARSRAGEHYFRELASYRERARSYLQQELDARNRDALLVAARAYLPDGLIGADPEREFAYLYAYSLGEESDSTVGPWLQAAEDKLTEEQRLRATAEGERLFAACCR